MTRCERLDQLLADVRTASTRFRPKDLVLLDSSLDLARLFAEASYDDRQRVVNDVSPELRKKLLAISVFMAEQALNDGSGRWIKGAVIMQVIEDFGWDYRENIRRLVLINFAAKRIGVSMQDVVDSVSELCTDRSRNYMREFCERDPSINSLGMFGIKVELVSGRLLFVPA